MFIEHYYALFIISIVSLEESPLTRIMAFAEIIAMVDLILAITNAVIP